MKVASKTLYIVGFVFNIISIAVFLLGLACSAIFLGLKNEIVEAATRDGVEALNTIEKVETVGTILLVIMIIGLVIEIAAIVVAIIALKKIDKGSTSIGPHIALLVIGIVGGETFYSVGAVFGLIYTNMLKEQNKK